MFIRKNLKNVGRVVMTLTVVLSCSALTAKDKSGVIMTVDGEEIPSEEFIYLYNKNNQQLPEPQSIDEYIPLFEAYRLKVAEAKSQGVDTTNSFRKEMKQYRRELLEPYITDTVFFNQLVDIAVDRDNSVVESSHIMIVRTHDADKDARNLEMLDSIRQELLQGADFIEMAKKYSQDKFSSEKGGYLGFNPAGTFPYAFETAVYETPEGGISEIVESHVGWHIVKSGARKSAEEYGKPAKKYSEIRADVARKSSSPFDSRYHELRKHKIDLLKKRHPQLANDVVNLPDDEAFDILIAAEEQHQYANNPDYKNLVDEYVNGSLLYEVSVENVWDKASNDEEGLEKYFQSHKGDYNWEIPHAKGILVQAVNDSIAAVVKDRVADLKPGEVIEYIKANFKKEASAQKFNVAKGSNPLIDRLVFGEGDNSKEQNAKVFIVNQTIVSQPEDLNDVKGLVITDYQEQLDKDWINNLKTKHSVEINQKELARIKKEFKQ